MAGLSLPFSSSFPDLAAAHRPPYGPTLVAIEAEFADVSRAAIDARLDALALPLFGLPARPPDEQVDGLAGAIREALAESHGDPECLLPGHALARGAGHPLLRAALAAELGRRVGIEARVGFIRRRWLIGLTAGRRRAIAELGSEIGDSQGVVCPCGHELAFQALSRLAHALARAKRIGDARRATALRLLLPLDADLRARVRQELAAYPARP